MYLAFSFFFLSVVFYLISTFFYSLQVSREWTEFLMKKSEVKICKPKIFQVYAEMYLHYRVFQAEDSRERLSPSACKRQLNCIFTVTWINGSSILTAVGKNKFSW